MTEEMSPEARHADRVRRMNPYLVGASELEILETVAANRLSTRLSERLRSMPAAEVLELRDGVMALILDRPPIEPWMTEQFRKHYDALNEGLQELAELISAVFLIDSNYAHPVVTQEVSDEQPPSRRGITRPPPLQLVVLVLFWLILLGGPVAEGKLPGGVQAMLGTEIGTVSLGLAITQMMNQKK